MATDPIIRKEEKPTTAELALVLGDAGCSAGAGVMVPPLSTDTGGASCKVNTLIARSEAWVAYRSIYRPSMSYSLVCTSFTKRELANIQRSPIRALLSTM